jgi:hypothetical protein
MTHLRDRKNRLSFVTNSTARYRGREREIVMEAFPEYAAVRLLGTRTKYEVSWRAIVDFAGRFARKENASASCLREFARSNGESQPADRFRRIGQGVLDDQSTRQC